MLREPQHDTRFFTVTDGQTTLSIHLNNLFTTHYSPLTMNDHRFTLTDERFMCPSCRDRKNSFKRYIDTVTETYLPDHVGRCNRQENCAYHLPPHEYFKTNPDKRPGGTPFPPKQPKQDDVVPYYVLH